MIIQRVWEMPNKWTFQIPSIMKLIRKYANRGEGWADPFAGQSRFCEYRNDLNPANKQPFCMEALDFLTSLRGKEIKGILIDPPYSKLQVVRSYKSIGIKFQEDKNKTGGFSQVRKEASRLLPEGGLAISFGWNTCGVGKGNGFEILEVLVVCHGQYRNDTLCTVERKVVKAKGFF